MDETPMYFEMPSNRTLDRVGAKTVSVKTRGKEKSRYTVIPAMMANGQKLKCYIILKGLKKVPKGLVVPKNIQVAVADKGSMNSGKINKKSW
jgi:hypothetical protein